MRPSPNLRFGNESHATAFQISDLGNATANEEKQEQNRKKSISSLSSSDFRSSPKKYFFGLSSANVFQLLRSMSAKPKTNYREIGKGVQRERLLRFFHILTNIKIWSLTWCNKNFVYKKGQRDYEI